jgi:hypothetical protein
MKISYQRTGGFAGMKISYELITENLLFEDAEELNQLLIESDFFNLPDQISAQNMGNDQFQHRLTVEAEERQHSVEFSDAAVPENLWPLLNQIRILSRKGRDS